MLSNEYLNYKIKNINIIVVLINSQKNIDKEKIKPYCLILELINIVWFGDLIMVKVIKIKYGNTKCYLIQGTKKTILIDTDWAGTLSRFFKKLGEYDLKVQNIDYLFITHYHPDHMGLAQVLADYGIKLVVLDSQLKYIHQSDYIFERQRNSEFEPIKDKQVLVLPIIKSRKFLKKCGIDGEILSTPGHSNCSVSYILDNGEAFVGNLYPIEQVAWYDNPVLTKSWEKLKYANVKKVHFAHYADEIISDWSQIKSV